MSDPSNCARQVSSFPPPPHSSGQISSGLQRDSRRWNQLPNSATLHFLFANHHWARRETSSELGWFELVGNEPSGRLGDFGPQFKIEDCLQRVTTRLGQWSASQPLVAGAQCHAADLTHLPDSHPAPANSLPRPAKVGLRVAYLAAGLARAGRLDDSAAPTTCCACGRDSRDRRKVRKGATAGRRRFTCCTHRRAAWPSWKPSSGRRVRASSVSQRLAAAADDDEAEAEAEDAGR